MYRQKTYQKIYLDKLFPCPPNKKYDNLMIDREAVSYITTPENSDLITAIINQHIPERILRHNINIMDGTACVGGDSISFGSIFGCVVAIEIDKNRFDMLVNNLREYELYNVIPINGNCLNMYKKINFIDIMYFDPPWGGRNYKDQKNIRLMIGNVFIDEMINNIFNGVARSDVNMVVLKLPKNYNLLELYQKTKRDDVTIYLYELNKMIIVVYKKNNYV